MNFDGVMSIHIPEGDVKMVAINGSVVWQKPEAPVVDKYSWEAVFASIDKGTYATDYAIGDLVPMDLGSNGIINMQIAAFDMDELADGSGKAPITWLARNTLANKVVYFDGDTCVGWGASYLRGYLDTQIKPLLPDVLKARIKTVNKTHLLLSTSNVETTQDQIWIPSVTEVAATSRGLPAYGKEETECFYSLAEFEYSEFYVRTCHKGGTKFITAEGSLPDNIQINSNNVSDKVWYRPIIGFCT